ncbi:MAG: thioredoxin fold domain-containing protein [Burkholderiaceae bacterium]
MTPRARPSVDFSLRRYLVAAALASVLPSARADAPTLPVAVALPEHLRLALQQGSPLVVMVSLPDCPFCKAVRESHLAPMQREQGLPVVQLDMMSRATLRDFQGAAVTHEQQIAAWGARVAPTVLFFGRRGQEVAQRLVGGYLPDFYGGYLEQRLETARKALV